MNIDTLVYLNYSIWLVGISIAVFIGYTVWVLAAFGELPISYSNTYYKIKEKYKNWGFLFPAYCIISTFFLMVPLVYLSGKNDALQILMLFIGIGLPLVGASADHKSSTNEAWVHIAGVIISAGALVVWSLIYFCGYIGCAGKYLYLIIAFTAGVFLVWGLINHNKKTFIWEMGGFIIAYEIMITVLLFELHLL